MAIKDTQHRNGEPPQDFESRPEFEKIIDTLRATPPIEPDPGFNARLMAAAGRQQAPAARRRAGNAAFSSLQRILANLTQTASAKEIALCFLLSGFFYFVLGVVLYSGLKTILGGNDLSGWLVMQPYLAFGFAAGLGALGLLILFDGQRALRIAHYGTIAYIVLVISNAVLLQVSPERPFNVFGLLLFTAGSLLLGVFLATAVRKFWRNAICTADSCSP
jgi:hypothetical protein